MRGAFVAQLGTPPYRRKAFGDVKSLRRTVITEL